MTNKLYKGITTVYFYFWLAIALRISPQKDQTLFWRTSQIPLASNIKIIHGCFFRLRAVWFGNKQNRNTLYTMYYIIPWSGSEVYYITEFIPSSFIDKRLRSSCLITVLTIFCFPLYFIKFMANLQLIRFRLEYSNSLFLNLCSSREQQYRKPVWKWNCGKLIFRFRWLPISHSDLP